MKKRSADIPIHTLANHASGVRVRAIKGSVIDNSAIMKAHRDDHYIFIFQQKGSIRFNVDFEENITTGNTVHCILPGQVHYFKSYHKVTAWFMAIDTMLVAEPYRKILEEDIINLKPVKPGKAQAEHLARIVESLYLLMKDNAANPSRLIIGSLASAYVGLIAETYIYAEASKPPGGSRVSAITRQFKKLLDQSYKTIKSPALFAEALNISLSYLNECVKNTTGLPVSYWVQHKIALEAKRMLCYTEMSIKEIAFALGFEDHTYFSRVFTKAAGVSPLQFRRTYRE